MSLRKQGGRGEDGFSLVEVSVAMAIAAVALVTLIGLIPQGLKTMQDAADQAISGRIHQQILSEIQLTPFRDEANSADLASSPIRAFHDQVRIYDAQGAELAYLSNGGGSLQKALNSASNDDLDFNWSYTARIWLPAFASDTGPPSLGSGPVKGDVSENSAVLSVGPELMTVIVEIVPFKIPGNSFVSSVQTAHSFFSAEENFPRIATHQTTVVRMGMNYEL